MNRLTTGMVPLLALLVAAGCSGDPTDSFRGTTARLDAAPSQLFLELGESKSVDVSAVDDQGNQISSVYEVTATGPGITVRRDSTFLPQYGNDSTLTVPAQAPVFRFVVTATGYGATDFTVSANGKDLKIPVQVVAQNTINAAISNLTPALGEVVTITAPAGVSFSPTTTATITGATSQPADVTVAPDNKSLTLVLPPNLIDAQITLSDVVSDASPGLVFSPSTADRVTTTPIASFSGTYSTLTPAGGQPVTVTLTDATFDPATTLILGAGAPIVTNISGNQITFLPVPGTIAPLTINGVILNALPQFSLSLPADSTDTIKVGTTVAARAGTNSPATAPVLAFPSPGQNSALYDAGTFGAGTCGSNSGVPCQLYKITLPTDASLDATLAWSNTADLGLYVLNSTGTTDTGQSCDANGNGADGGLEACTITLTAGTYILGVVDFGPFYDPPDPAPDWISLSLTPTPAP